MPRDRGFAPHTFGTVLHRLTFGEAIQRGLLSDYQVAIVGVTDEAYRDYAERAVFIRLDGVGAPKDARTLAGQIGLAKALRKCDLRRAITFHSRVSWARSFSSTLPGAIDWMPRSQKPTGSVKANYVSGEMTSGHREVLLDSLRHLDNERAVLANARCLGEGVDVPSVDGVAFIDARRSQVDIV